MPVNALSAGESNTEQQTLDDLNTENSNSTNESNATSAEVATDSNASEDTSISDISSNDIDSSEEKLNNEISLQSDNTEEDGEEPSTDNWELGLVFYDSTVDNGKTPLTSIDWDASDGGYGEGTPRVITVQINYKNTNAVTTYQPGELELSIPNLIYNTTRKEESSPFWNSSVIVGANDSTHNGYDWNFSTASTPSNTQQTYNFTNAVAIEEKTNFEGSIQIVYTITPKRDLIYEGESSECRSQYKEECTHSYNLDLQAKLKDIVETNTLNFSYTRTYIHPWTRTTIFTKTASKITSFDGLPSDHNDYIWVVYNFSVKIPYRGYPHVVPVGYKEIQLRDTFPEECIVMETDGKIAENEYIKIIGTGTSDSSYITANKKLYVGYPKSIYNEENKNLNIINSADIYVHWANGAELEYAKTATANVNLADFNFTYTGNLYGIQKSTVGGGDDALIYQDIQKDMSNNQIRWYSNVIARYTGQPMTVKIGDDILYATNNEGDYVKLSDNDYYFNDISFPVSGFKNGNNDVIPKGKYNCELWVRYAGNTEYTLYDEFTNGNPGSKNSASKDSSYSFSKADKIVGFYFLIKDMTEGIGGNYGVSFYHYMRFIKQDIPQNGTIYNFNYLQVYFKDGDGNLVLQNEPELSSYNSFLSKEEIAKFDQETYGTYMQRATSYRNWSYKDVSLRTSLGAYKKAQTNITQDAENEKFIGKFDIGASLSSVVYNSKYEDQYIPNKDNALCGFILYDLLPEGMELESTKEEIINSVSTQEAWHGFMWSSYYDFELKSLSYAEVRNIIKSNSTVNIYENWRNTGRTKIEIIADFEDTPIYLMTKNDNSSWSQYLCYTYKWSVSYDSFLEYGNVWENRVYAEFTEQPMSANKKIYGIDDNGIYDKDAIDINENDQTDDKVCTAKDTATITSVVSTHQDVTKYVQTDKSNYSTGTVKASPSSEYTYKLRARTGTADVTNFIIYDSIEEYVQDPYSAEQSFITAYGTKKHWNGSFLGIDTSYAEAKGYVVKPYYSENNLAGNLYNEDGSLNTDWKEYFDSVDKSKVKSLAFEYLDKDDETQKAVLPANSQTYVLVKMKAPPEENRKILSYNGCRTQWQALDDYDRPVDFITGINSNIVKVSLSDYYDLTVNKIWNDENDKWGLRPDSVDIILKKDGTEVERKQITKDNLSVTFTDLLVEDSGRYTIEEEFSLNYEASIEYNEIDDCYEVTNTLKDDIFTGISGTKTWVNDEESDRPENITINLLKNGEIYRTTTTSAEKDWKYSFIKVPIYNADETECIYSVEEVPVEKYSVQYITPSNGLAIKFNSQFKTESVNYDYVEIYCKQDGQTYKLGKWGGTTLAGQTVYIPTNDFYLYWRTDGSQCNYYGFAIDSIEPTDVETPTLSTATLPNYTTTELTGNEYPESPNHGNYGNNINMLWHYTGSFSSDVPAEGLFNIVNTYEGVDAINLSFVKEVEGTEEAFEKLQLKKDALYKFQISMKNRDTGNIISVPIDNKNTVTVNEVPLGTYIITEKDDMYFDFVSMESLNSVEGVTFEKVGNDYVLTITKDASEDETLQIKVNNKIEPDRPYEDKEEKENLFKYKDESIEINTYIVYWYDSNGNFIKTPETRTGTVGTTIHATTDDKNISGYKYDESNSLNIESIILSKNEGNKLKLYFNKL